MAEESQKEYKSLNRIDLKRKVLEINEMGKLLPQIATASENSECQDSPNELDIMKPALVKGDGSEVIKEFNEMALQ